MKSLEEMRGWLISKKRRFPGSGMEPLPKWLAELNDEIFQNNEITDAILAALDGPSVTREWIEEQTGGWLAPFEVGQTAADPRRIEVLATPLIIEMLKSVGVEIKEVCDEED